MIILSNGMWDEDLRMNGEDEGEEERPSHSHCFFRAKLLFTLSVSHPTPRRATFRTPSREG